MRTLDPLRHQWLTQLRQHRAIAIIRAPSVSIGLSMAQAAAAGGFRLLEITWTNNANPPEMVELVRHKLPHCTIGAGSVLTQKDLRSAIHAGTQFVFTPHTDAALIHKAHASGTPMIAGAMTPTEVVNAWQIGAASVKVFPIAALGNSTYIRSLLDPLGSIPLVPTGGVTSESAPQMIEAGAIAVGLSTALFPKDEVARENWNAIEARSRYLLTLLAKAACSPSRAVESTSFPA